MLADRHGTPCFKQLRVCVCTCMYDVDTLILLRSSYNQLHGAAGDFFSPIKNPKIKGVIKGGGG